eukprot:COSAG01_NODE_24074_length_791_cov_1.505780_1_plen_115_part_10
MSGAQARHNAQAWLDRVKAIFATGSAIGITEAWVGGAKLTSRTPAAVKCIALLAHYHFEDYMMRKDKMAKWMAGPRSGRPSCLWYSLFSPLGSSRPKNRGEEGRNVRSARTSPIE